MLPNKQFVWNEEKIRSVVALVAAKTMNRFLKVAGMEGVCREKIVDVGGKLKGL